MKDNISITNSKSSKLQRNKVLRVVQKFKIPDQKPAINSKSLASFRWTKLTRAIVKEAPFKRWVESDQSFKLQTEAAHSYIPQGR